MAQKNIFVVEDEEDILDLIRHHLLKEGYVVSTATNGMEAVKSIQRKVPDLVLLDVMLPGMDGTKLCKTLREEWHNKTPILMLTARDTILDKVAGFDSGGDDYLVKPFSLLEVEVRLKALVRRARGGVAPAAPLRVGSLVYDASTMTAVRSGQALALTKTGYRLLHCLMRESPKIVSRDKLAAEVWGDDRPDSDALRTHIHALRQALDKGHDVAMLRTVQGVGYRLVAGDD